MAKCCATDMNKRRIHEASCIIKLGTACKCVGRKKFIANIFMGTKLKM